MRCGLRPIGPCGSYRSFQRPPVEIPNSITVSWEAPDHRSTARERAFEIWRSAKPAGQEHFAKEMLVEARGVLKESAFRRLLEQRDDRRMHLNE